MSKNLIPAWLENGYRNALAPLVRWAVCKNLDPNLITTWSLVLNVISAGVMVAGHLRWAGALILLAGTLDIMDGALARAAGRMTKFGALYDSTLDRYSEMVVFFALLFYYLNRGYAAGSWVIISICLALCGSLMVSYVRARAEGLGFECKIGLMQRPERIVLLGFGALFHEAVLAVFIALIAVLSNITAVQRIIHIHKLASKVE